MDKRVLFQYLQLKQFTKVELNQVFDELLANAVKSSDSVDNHDKEHNSQQKQQQQQHHHHHPIDLQSVGCINHDIMSTFLLNRIRQINYQQQQRLALEYDLDHQDSQNLNVKMKSFANQESKRIMRLLSNSNDMNPNVKMTRDEFCNKIEALATELDTSRTIPISASMLLVGSSVGVIIPVMPYVVQNLGISAGEYGIIVASFALAKLFANVPAAVFVEKHGRKPFLVYSLVVVGLGVGGISLASQWEHLVVCRTLTGVGVSLLSTAATLSIADCSTPLNRARTMAPMMSAFAAGTALGPALGGLLADTIGINSTFAAVGTTYFGLTFINKMVLSETQLASEIDRIFPWNEGLTRRENIKRQARDGYGTSIQTAISQWTPLWKNTKVRHVVMMNGFYWFSLSGAQMTLLPLILTDQAGLAMSATQVGYVYMIMSLVQVLANPFLGYLIDKIGKAPGIVGGCGLLSLSMFTLPFCTDFDQVASTLGFWALGSTMLSTAPTSYVSDNVHDNKRAQALALLRTAGDVGFFCGAVTMGNTADLIGIDVSVEVSSALLLCATTWFGLRRWFDYTKVRKA
jgi:MFS family permease